MRGVIFLFSSVYGRTEQILACFYSSDLDSYNGNLRETISGETCQNWNAKAPHRPKHGTTMNHNYCRNPDNDPNGPWCYTTDPNVRFAYCDIPRCHGSGETCLEDRSGTSYRGNFIKHLFLLYLKDSRTKRSLSMEKRFFAKAGMQSNLTDQCSSSTRNTTTVEIRTMTQRVLGATQLTSELKRHIAIFEYAVSQNQLLQRDLVHAASQKSLRNS